MFDSTNTAVVDLLSPPDPDPSALGTLCDARSPWGYFWMVANCCATAGYVLYMKYATKTIKLPR